MLGKKKGNAMLEKDWEDMSDAEKDRVRNVFQVQELPPINSMPYALLLTHSTQSAEKFRRISRRGNANISVTPGVFSWDVKRNSEHGKRTNSYRCSPYRNV